MTLRMIGSGFGYAGTKPLKLALEQFEFWRCCHVCDLGRLRCLLLCNELYHEIHSGVPGVDETKTSFGT